MMRWRASLNVSRWRSPISFPRGVGQRLGGDHERVERRERRAARRRRLDVKPSVARTTIRPARCRRSSRTRPDSMAVAPRALVDACRRAARPPRPGRGRGGPGGWRRSAACRAAPSTPAASRRSAASARSSQRRSSSPSPNWRASASSSRSRTVWAGLRGEGERTRPWRSGSRCPPPSATRPTSSTVSYIARCMAIAAGLARARRHGRRRRIGSSAEHQPPLRPLAPKPATSASSTTTRRLGSSPSR